jgi:hypothetical protein
MTQPVFSSRVARFSDAVCCRAAAIALEAVGRQGPVVGVVTANAAPAGQMIVAQRFIAGIENAKSNQSPEGTTEIESRPAFSVVPTGLATFRSHLYPTANCWATINRPSGTAQHPTT